ncbi:Hypothetical predicted protein [Mytilus galloprovincialis]|uniref:Uncharacterized protein n=1 Tax=Mytilus galloprovincialis TaxID=29158 RepID=A0A8B6F6C5_MYTGA|nr:Hypothetical predicted protein [Mytilus galloprovincialis]
MSGIAALITLIPAFLVLRKFIETTRRIKHVNITFIYKIQAYLCIYINSESTIHGRKRKSTKGKQFAIEFHRSKRFDNTIPTEIRGYIRCHEKSDLADTEHNNTINDGYNFINTIFFDEQMDKKYNNIPPISHMNTIYAGIDVINRINCNGRRGIQQHPTFESHDSVFVQHHSLHSQYNGFRKKSN